MATLYFEVQADYQKVIELRNQIDRLQSTMRSFNATTPINQIRAFEQELARCKGEMNTIVGSAANMGAQFQNHLVTSVQSSTSAMTGLGTSFKNTQSSMNSFSSGIAMFTRQFSQAMLAFKGLQAALGAVSGAMNTIVDFEASNSVLQAVSGSTAEQLESMRDKALELGRATRYTASDVTNLEISLSKLGFRADDINNMSSSILQFGMATGASLDDAATITGAALRMFGADAEQATRYTSAMSAAINKTALNFQAVADNLATFGPIASTVGMNIEQALAIFGKLKDMGYQGSTAATSVRNILNEMSSGKLSKALGYEVKSFDDFIKALGDLKNLGYDQGTGAAMKAVGKRGGAQLIALVKNADAVKAKYEEIAAMSVSSEGMDNLANTMNDNVRGAIARVQSAWQDLVLQFSDATGPMATVLNKVSEGLNAIVDTMKGVDNGNTLFGLDATGIQLFIDSLGTLITIMGVYKAEQLGLVAIQKVKAILGASEYANYQKAIAALTNLTAAEEVNMSAQMRAAVEKGVLTAEEAKHITMLQNEARAQLTALQAELAKAKADDVAAASLMKSARLSQQKAAIELASAKATGNATAIALAEKRLLLANTELDTAAEMKNATATNVNNLSKRASAVGASVDAASKTIDTAATWSLTGAVDALTASMMANPLMWIAAIIGAVIYVIYRCVTATSAHTAAQDALNESLQGYSDQLKQAKTDAESWIETMNDNTATALQQVEAYEKLKQAYEDFGNYTPEEIKNISKEERDRIMNRQNEANEDEFLQKRKEMYNKINQLYIDNPFTATDKMEDDIAKSVGGEKFGEQLIKELEAVREKAGDVRSAINEVIGESTKIQSEFQTNRNKANMQKAFKGFFDTKELSLEQDKIESYNETLDKLIKAVAFGKESSFDARLDSGKDMYENVAAQYEMLKDRKAQIDTEIYKTSDEKRKEDLVKQRADIEAALAMFETLKDGMKDGNKGIFEGLKAAYEELTNMNISNDAAISIGESYDVVYEALAKLKQEYENTGNVSQESGQKAETAIRNQVDVTKKKISELEAKLNDPNLTAAEKQQVRVDLAGQKQTLSDLNSLLRQIASSVASKNYTAVINIVTRYTEIGKDVDKKKKLGKTEEYKHSNGTTYRLTDYSDGKPDSKGGFYRTYYDENGNKIKVTYIAPNAQGRARASSNRGKAAAGAATKGEGNGEDDGGNSDNNTDTKSGKKGKGEDKAEKARKERVRQARADKDAELKIRQDKIDMMQESTQKTIAQINLDYDKEIEAIKRREYDLKEKIYEANKGKYKTVEGVKLSQNQQDMLKADTEKNEYMLTKKLMDATKDYQSTEDERNEKRRKITDDILGMEKEIANEKAKGGDANLTKINMFIKRVKSAQNELKKLNINDSMMEFMREYGTFDEKREAAKMQYDKDMLESNGVGDIAIAKAKYEETISKLDAEELKQELGWDTIFAEIDNQSIETLEHIREAIKENLSLKELSVENAKVFIEQLNKIQNAIAKKKSSWLDMFSDSPIANVILQRKQEKERNKEAQQEYDEAEKLYKNSKYSEVTQKLDIQELLKSKGVKVSNNDLNATNANKIADAFEKAGGNTKELGEKMSGLLKTQNQKSQASTAMTAAKGKMGGGGGFANTMAILDAVFTGIHDQVESLQGFIKDLGKENTKFGRKFSEAADSYDSAFKGWESFKKGDVVGVFRNNYEAWNKLFDVFEQNNMATLQDDIDRLTNSNKVLASVISDLTDELKDGTFAESLSTSSRIIALLNEKERNSSQIIQDELAKWSHGSNSLQYNTNKDESFASILRAWNSYTKRNDTSIQEMVTADASVWKSFRNSAEGMSYYTELMSVLRNADTNKNGTGVDELIEEYIEEFGDAEDKILDQVKEKMTSITFDSMYDEFVSTISNMEAVTSDFTDNVSKMMYNAIVNNVISDAYKKKMEDLYDGLYAELKSNNGTLSSGYVEWWKNQYTQYSKEANEMAEKIAELTGYDENNEISATSKSTANMSEETAEELNGRFTALQIAGEAILANVQSTIDMPLSTLNQNMLRLMGKGTEMYNVADESRQILAESLIEIREINENTKTMSGYLKVMKADIEQVKNNTKRL